MLKNFNAFYFYSVSTRAFYHYHFSPSALYQVSLLGTLLWSGCRPIYGWLFRALAQASFS